MTDAEIIEDLRKMIAFYQNEAPELSHPVEKEFRKLALMDPDKRTKKQQERVIALARVCTTAINASTDAFHYVLDEFAHTDKCRKKFSLCLDCNAKNRCGRYSAHRNGK